MSKNPAKNHKHVHDIKMSGFAVSSIHAYNVLIIYIFSSSLIIHDE